MINRSLSFVTETLDQFLKNKFGLDESKIVLNGVVSPNGETQKINQNKIVLSLINVVRESNKQYYSANTKLDNGQYGNRQPEERFNLDILLSANFDDYAEGLKFLDAVIYFFQANPSLDPTNYPSAKSNLRRLDFEIEQLTYVEMHNFWSALGAKYQPSVIYKLRSITVQSDETTVYVSSVTNPATNISPNE